MLLDDLKSQARRMIRDNPALAQEIAIILNPKPVAMGLTHRQAEVLAFLRDRMRGGNEAPSFEEIMGVTAQRSKSGVHRILSALEDRGHIRRYPRRSRAIEVLTW